MFSIQKRGFLSKVKEIKRLCGDAAGYVAQTNAPIDAEIGQKDFLWMETGVNTALVANHHLRVYISLRPAVLERSKIQPLKHEGIFTCGLSIMFLFSESE